MSRPVKWIRSPANQIWQLLRELNRRFNLTSIIVSHDRDIARVVDRVIGIRDGKISTEIVRQSHTGLLDDVLSAGLDDAESDPLASDEPTDIAGSPPLQLEERVVLDAVGRLQMPHEYLEQRGIGRRAVVQLVEDGILVRQAQEQIPFAGDVSASGAFFGEEDDLSAWEQDPTPRRKNPWWRRLLLGAPREVDETPDSEQADNPWASDVTSSALNLSDAPEDNSRETLQWDNDRTAARATFAPPDPTPEPSLASAQSEPLVISEFYRGPLVEVSELQRVYSVGEQSVYALRGIDLSISRRCFALFRGRSGSGKTTLLNLIGSLDTPTAGRVSLFGQDIDKLTADQCAQIRQHYIGFVFQAFSLIPTLSAQENVEMTLRILGSPPQSAVAGPPTASHWWALAAGPITVPLKCLAASSSVFRSPAPSHTARLC